MSASRYKYKKQDTVFQGDKAPFILHNLGYTHYGYRNEICPFCGACETKAAWRPTKLGARHIDYAIGMNEAFGILAVLRAVERLPEASHINSALLDAALILMAAFATQYLSAGGKPEQNKNEVWSARRLPEPSRE